MRTFKFKKRLPRKRILEILREYDDYNDLYFDHAKSWIQIETYERTDQPDLYKELKNILAECLGVDPNKLKNIIAHVITNNVPNHKDNMSKGVYLIPLKFCKSIYFYEDYKEKCFSNDFYIKFNDWNQHGVGVPYYSHNIIISIDT